MVMASDLMESLSLKQADHMFGSFYGFNHFSFDYSLDFFALLIKILLYFHQIKS